MFMTDQVSQTGKSGAVPIRKSLIMKNWKTNITFESHATSKGNRSQMVALQHSPNQPMKMAYYKDGEFCGRIC
jgi:hypothetical protein